VGRFRCRALTTHHEPLTTTAYNSRVRLLRQLAILAGAFGVGVGLAELFGAVNLGTAFGVGQISFTLALVYLLLRG
jgi:hypothetical protein